VNSRSRIITDRSNLVKVVGFMAFLLLAAGPARAQSPLKAKATGLKAKAAGEIVAASQTTINGFSAISGATVFNNNRIKTGKQGAAIISLGRLGRIEFGPETDMTLRLSEAGIGGELRSNRVVVSAREGVAIAINTPNGVVTSDGRQPAVLTISVDGGGARVIPHLGAARVVSAGENSSTAAKELSQSPRGEGWRRAGLAAGVIGGATIGTTAAKAATATPSAPKLSELFKAGINYSTDPKFDKGQGHGPEDSFDTSITCRDSNKKICHKYSNYKPESSQ
jgi:hypothetical protein